MRNIIEWFREIEVTLTGGFVWVVAALSFIGLIEFLVSLGKFVVRLCGG